MTMPPCLAASSPTYLPYSHLRSSNSPDPPSSRDMQAHPVVTHPPPQWNPSYAKHGYLYPVAPLECADCNTECTVPTCSTSNELTSQCTDQCVVIACNDPEHNSLNCIDGQSHCDFVCDSATDCSDCNGFDAFLQCCEEYHTCYTDLTRPANFSQQPQRQQNGGHDSWQASFAAALCDCGQIMESDKTYPTTHAASLSPVTITSTIVSPATKNDSPQYSPVLEAYNSPLLAQAHCAPIPPTIPPIPPPQTQPVYDIFQGQPQQPHATSAPSPHASFLTCMWGDCQAQFASLSELVGHVNLVHLHPPTTPGLPCGQASSSETQGHSQTNDLMRLPCLWGNCNEYLPSQILSGASSGSAMDDIFSNLATHLFQDHLGIHDFQSNGTEIPPETTPSQQREQGRQTQEMQPPQYEQSGPDATKGTVAPSAASEERSSEESPDLQTHNQEVNVPNTPSSRTVPTPISSPATSARDVPLTPGEGHLCRWDQCGMIFGSCNDLMSHMSAVHVGSGKPQYDCLWEGCIRNGNKGFSSKQKISRHLQSHTGYRPFQCPECLQNFSEAATLQQHIRRHTQEKPYKCDFPGCGKSFAITGALTIHKRVHNGVKPFKCSYCNRGFAESSNLSKHLRTHTGERPYICTEPDCGKAFARPDQLTRHMGVHRKKALAANAAVQ